MTQVSYKYLPLAVLDPATISLFGNAIHKG